MAGVFFKAFQKENQNALGRLAQACEKGVGGACTLLRCLEGEAQACLQGARDRWKAVPVEIQNLFLMRLGPGVSPPPEATRWRRFYWTACWMGATEACVWACSGQGRENSPRHCFVAGMAHADPTGELYDVQKASLYFQRACDVLESGRSFFHCELAACDQGDGAACLEFFKPRTLRKTSYTEYALTDWLFQKTYGSTASDKPLPEEWQELRRLASQGGATEDCS